MRNGYTRKEVADKLNIGNETLRYYEKIGVIPKPVRTKEGYRIYNDEDLFRLKFILKSKRLGFSLREISAALCNMGENKKINNDILSGLITAKIDEIDRKISDLKELKEMLENSRRNTNLAECGLLNFYYKKS
jgi:MerR family transcriptional regulator, mercuric resistance operon regulatory protein